MTTNSERESLQITILGSGTSTGIPVVGCPCDVCQSINPKDTRLRTSILIEFKNKKCLLVDTGPDLRTQLLTHQVHHIDGCLLTHEHADHLNGIDDLRPLCFFPDKKAIPIFSYKAMKPILEKKFDYIFLADQVFSKDRPVIGGGIPRLKFQEIPVGLNSSFTLLEREFTTFFLPHGYTYSLGFYVDGFAYLIDCHKVPTNVVEFLREKKVKHLIIDCVHDKPDHKTHLCLEQSLKYIDEIQPLKASLIHMGHRLAHDHLEKICQERYGDSVGPTYDGQVIEIF